MSQFAESGRSCEFDCMVVLVDIDVHLCHTQTSIGLVFVHKLLMSKKECIKHLSTLMIEVNFLRKSKH